MIRAGARRSKRERVVGAIKREGALLGVEFAPRGDLKSLLRGGASDTEIVNEIASIWRVRDDRYSEIRTAETARQRKVEMSYIGG